MPFLRYCINPGPFPKKGCRKVAGKGFDRECPHQNIECKYRRSMAYINMTEEQVDANNSEELPNEKQQTKKYNRQAVIIKIVKDRSR